DRVVLGGVPRPVHFHAVLRGVVLEFLEVAGEVRQRMLLDGGGERAQFLPLRHRFAFTVPLLAQVPQALVVKLDMVAGLDEDRGAFGVVDALHSRAPFRICATWMNLTGRPRRSAHPFWCMRQDMSAETMYSAPALL